MNKIKVIFIFISWCISATGMAQVAESGKPLPAWKEGYFDLHHINTGKGNATFYIFPDGTTMLIDAGELSPLDPRSGTPRNAAARPDSSRKPYEWIAHYIKQVAPKGDKTVLDYALITHFHDDHFGAWYPLAPKSSSGKYLLTGITGVGELIPIRQLIDRGYPGYDYPYDIKRSAEKFKGGEIAFGNTMSNYFNFLKWQQSKGLQAASLRAGSKTQIRILVVPSRFPSFYVQGIKSGRWVWTGKDSAVHDLFPQSPSGTQPDENSLSLALTFRYGPFLYYTGGDCAGNVFPGDAPWRDVETPVARVVGEVDVATMDHHGNRDAVNEFQVRTLQPRVWIGQTWSSDHPGHEVLVRMTSRYLYPKERDLFATNMLEANRHVIGPLIDRSYKSQQGHIIVRVLPGGENYYVIILDDANEAKLVKAVFGPYESGKSKVGPK